MIINDDTKEIHLSKFYQTKVVWHKIYAFFIISPNGVKTGTTLYPKLSSLNGTTNYPTSSTPTTSSSKTSNIKKVYSGSST